MLHLNISTKNKETGRQFLFCLLIVILVSSVSFFKAADVIVSFLKVIG